MVSVADGVDRSVVLIPQLFVPLGVDDIVATWRSLTGMSTETDELARCGAEPAGTKSFVYLAAWIPFASDFGGNHLFIDTRPGPRSGCISEWNRDEGSLRPPLWASLDVLVEQVATSLRKKRWRGADGEDFVPRVQDGRLHWDASGECETLSWNATIEEVQQKRQDLPTRVMLLSSAGIPDSEIASQLNITVERVANLRDEWRRTH